MTKVNFKFYLKYILNGNIWLHNEFDVETFKEGLDLYYEEMKKRTPDVYKSIMKGDDKFVIYVNGTPIRDFINSNLSLDSHLDQNCYKEYFIGLWDYSIRYNNNFMLKKKYSAKSALDAKVMLMTDIRDISEVKDKVSSQKNLISVRMDWVATRNNYISTNRQDEMEKFEIKKEKELVVDEAALRVMSLTDLDVIINHYKDMVYEDYKHEVSYKKVIKTLEKIKVEKISRVIYFDGEKNENKSYI